MPHPLVCVPVGGKNSAEISIEISAVLEMPSKPDVIEWRADSYRDADYVEMLTFISEKLPKLPIIFTLRGAKEGGACKLSESEREEIYVKAIESGKADLIDIELRSDINVGLIKAAKKNGVKVIISFHDFEGMPDVLPLLREMKELGCDVAKVAVTPKNREDVFALMSVCGRFFDETGGFPAIGISMGELGKITRICGGMFGSVMTFGVLKTATAPGQIDVGALIDFISIIGR